MDVEGAPLLLQRMVKSSGLGDEPRRVLAELSRINAGRKPFDVVLMFKILVLKFLYNLSYDQVGCAALKVRTEGVIWAFSD